VIKRGIEGGRVMGQRRREEEGSGDNPGAHVTNEDHFTAHESDF
jgi:hypothetical protein